MNKKVYLCDIEALKEGTNDKYGVSATLVFNEGLTYKELEQVIYEKYFYLSNNNLQEEIEEKQVAEQKVLTAKQELEREKIEAEKKIVIAKSEKEANELKQNSLTDKLIKEKFIEKWNGQLPTVTNGNAIFDISSLIK